MVFRSGPWCNGYDLQLGLGFGTGNGYLMPFFFFPYLKVTFVLLFWAGNTLKYALIYNPGI